MKATITSLTIFCFCLLIGCNSCTNKPGPKTGLSESRTTILLNDGTKLTYFIEGEGYPCIVVTEGELLTNAISKELKNHFKFIFINARMNVSDPGDVNKITFDVLVDDIDQIRKALDLNKICVFGHSVSGLIAFEYAKKYPQFTSHVIMNGTSPVDGQLLDPLCNMYWETNASKERKEALTKSWSNLSKDSLENLGTSESRKLKYVLDGPKCFYDYNFRADSLLKNTYWNASVWDQIFTKLIPVYDIGKGKTVDIPVFLSQGKYDFYDPYIAWDSCKSKIPNLSFHLFEKSGHYSLYEEEELFRRELITWFENTRTDKK